MAPDRRRVGVAVGVGYLALLATLLIDPTGTASTRGTGLLVRLALATPAPWWIVTHVEFAANVMVFVPVPLIGTLLIGRRATLTWVGGCFYASLAVEMLQLVSAGARVASPADVVANTIGALIGAGCAAVCFEDRPAAGQ